MADNWRVIETVDYMKSARADGVVFAVIDWKAALTWDIYPNRADAQADADFLNESE